MENEFIHEGLPHHGGEGEVGRVVKWFVFEPFDHTVQSGQIHHGGYKVKIRGVAHHQNAINIVFELANSIRLSDSSFSAPMLMEIHRNFTSVENFCATLHYFKRIINV